MNETQTQQAMLITKDMTIGDVVQKYPHVTEILLKNGVHCVGCGARFFETLEMGFKGHGMTDQQVDTIVQQLNQAAKDNPIEGEIISVTKTAAVKLKELLTNEHKEKAFLRMLAVHNEDGSFSYGLDIVDESHQDDIVIEAHGLKLLADPASLPVVKGARIDYAGGESAGFRISNTQKNGGCGCH